MTAAGRSATTALPPACSMTKKTRAVRPARRFPPALVLAAGAVIVATTTGVAWVVRHRPPAPPNLANLGPMSPEVEAVVRGQAAAVQATPRDGVRWAQFGMACEANGLVDPARAAYRTASTLDPQNPKWLYRLAAVDARVGDTTDAIDDLRRAASLVSNYAPIHWRLGLLLLDANDADGAGQEFARATAIDPGDPAGWIGLARTDLQRGDAASAARTLERLLARQTGNRYAMQLLGTALERMGRHDEAAALLAAGTAEQPDWSDRWTDEMLEWRRGFAVRLKDATAYFANGDHDRAIRLLEQLATEKPDDVPLLAHLGEAYIAAGRADEGTRTLERVVAREPDRVDAWVRLATGYLQQERFDDARTATERALALDGSYAPARETLGMVLWRTGNEQAALKALDTACRLDPRNTRALVWAGMIATNLGRLGPALDRFTRATELDPTLVPAWLGIANARMSQGDLDAATLALQRATALAGDAPAVQQTAGRLSELRSARAATPRGGRR